MFAWLHENNPNARLNAVYSTLPAVEIIPRFYTKKKLPFTYNFLYTLIHRKNIVYIIQESYFSTISIHHTIEPTPILFGKIGFLCSYSKSSGMSIYSNKSCIMVLTEKDIKYKR